MKIFITGATGFIGTHLIEALNGRGHALKCLVRKTSNIKTCEKYGCELVYGDITDKASVLKGMKGCDWVINLANIYSMWEPDPSVYDKVNIEGTRNVMEAAIESSIKKVVHISTIAIFGNTTDNPITEKSEPGSVRYSKYAETKYQGDVIAWNLCKIKHLPLVVVYPCLVIGPGDTKATGEYMRQIIQRKMPALVYPNSRLTFVHVKDVVAAIIKVLEEPDNIGEKYIIGKETYSIIEISNMVSDAAGVPLPKIILPGWFALIIAFVLTKIADVIKKPPLWGLARDQIRTIKKEIKVDNRNKMSTNEIQYMPIKMSINQIVENWL